MHRIDAGFNIEDIPIKGQSLTVHPIFGYPNVSFYRIDIASSLP